MNLATKVLMHRMPSEELLKWHETLLDDLQSSKSLPIVKNAIQSLKKPLSHRNLADFMTLVPILKCSKFIRDMKLAKGDSCLSFAYHCSLGTYSPEEVVGGYASECKEF